MTKPNLDRRIVLVHPGATVRRDDGSSSVQVASREGRWAQRRDGPGGEGTPAETVTAERTVRFTIRRLAGETIDTTCWLEDGGEEYRIESVFEPSIPGSRREYLTLVGVRRGD